MSSVPTTAKITGLIPSLATAITGPDPLRAGEDTITREAGSITKEVFSITREEEFSIAKEGGSISILLEGDMEGVV